MSKAVMISIQPHWVDLIATGRKLIEIRKTKPKLNTPFKVYIYCTQDKYVRFTNRDNWDGNGKIIGEFVCDEIEDMTENIVTGKGNEHIKKESCLSGKQLNEYAQGKALFGWHISNLVIYDEPKEILSFSYPCKEDCDTCKYNRLNPWANSIEPVMMCQRDVTKAPQSWCYVEEIGT